MTTSLTKPAAHVGVWNTMPGWGIAGDLTPPEIVAARKLRVLRRLIAIALAGVVVLLAGWYAYAQHQHSAAEDAAAAAASQTGQLTAEQHKYIGVTRIQAATQAVQAQLASLTAGDSDVSTFETKVLAALPPKMTITSLTVAYNQTGSQVATTPGLDTSGNPVIATATVSGTQTSVLDTAAFLAALEATPGFVNVVPSTNSNDDKKFAITFAATSVLLSSKTTTGGHS